MGARGPRKSPNRLRLVRGTARPYRMNADEVEFDPARPEELGAPDWLTAHAATYWNRIVPIISRQRVLTEADLEALATMCALYAKVRQMFEAGVDVSASLVNALRAYQSEFGLTPASRTKIQRGDGAKEAGFKKYGRKPNTKGGKAKA